MPIDSNILFRLTQPFNPQEYLQNEARTRFVQNTARMSDMELGDLLRLHDREKAVDTAARNAYQTPAPVTTQQPPIQLGGTTLPGPQSTVQGPAQFNRGAYLSNLPPEMRMQAESQFGAQDAAAAKSSLDLREQLQRVSKNDLEIGLQKLNAAGRVLGASLNADPQARPQIYAQGVQLLKQNGWLDPNHPEQYPGDAAVKSELMTTMDAMQQFTVAHNEATAAETTRHNRAEEANQGQQRDVQTRGQNITMRGQNMTDARMRDQNQIARDTKLDMNRAQDQNQLSGFNADMDRLSGAANELKNDPGLGRITGITGKLPNVPGMAGASAKAKLDTLKSQVAFGVLQNLRNSSKTGGALGQVSDKEEQMLSSNLAGLDTSQGEADFRKSLDKIIAYADGAKQRARDALMNKYGGASPVAQSSGGVQVIDPRGVVHTFPNQKSAAAFKKAAGIR